MPLGFGGPSIVRDQYNVPRESNVSHARPLRFLYGLYRLHHMWARCVSATFRGTPGGVVPGVGWAVHERRGARTVCARTGGQIPCSPSIAPKFQSSPFANRARYYYGLFLLRPAPCTRARTFAS